MTPKEKAEELFDQFRYLPYIRREQAIECVRILVNEVLSLEINEWMDSVEQDEKFWNEVKAEIEKL